MTKILKVGSKALKVNSKLLSAKEAPAGHDLTISVMRFGLNSNFYYSTDSGATWTTIVSDTTVSNVTSVKFKIVAGSEPGETIIRDLEAAQDIVSANAGETKVSDVVVLADDKIISCMEQPE